MTNEGKEMRGWIGIVPNDANNGAKIRLRVRVDGEISLNITTVFSCSTYLSLRAKNDGSSELSRTKFVLATHNDKQATSR